MVLTRRQLLATTFGAVVAPAVGPANAPAGQRQPARTLDIFFAPSRPALVDAMLQLAGVSAGDTVYDLGSGDGRILIRAAQKFGAKGVGIELDPRLVELSRQIAVEGEVADRVTFLEADFFVTDLSTATVVTLYLSELVNARLEPKLKKELKPGTRIVSQRFGIGSWPPERTIKVLDEVIHLWRMPAVR
jgi:SAM-dependent methyltransferase